MVADWQRSEHNEMNKTRIFYLLVFFVCVLFQRQIQFIFIVIVVSYKLRNIIVSGLVQLNLWYM